MLLPRPEDTIHKAMLYRLLMALADDSFLAAVLRFKGGTCAAMMGYIDRFSVDLDFDFLGSIDKIPETRHRIEALVKKLGFAIKDWSKKGIQYFLKYKAPLGARGKRNTIKLDVVFPAPKNNLYDAFYFSDIDRTLLCQTPETMFANKLVSVIDRYEKYHSVAGRDLYDIHSFFLHGLEYHKPIIEERRKVSAKIFLEELTMFIKKHFTETILNQDLNMLLPEKEFQRIRKILISEVLMFLNSTPRSSAGAG